jgi:hypothetical protein
MDTTGKNEKIERLLRQRREAQSVLEDLDAQLQEFADGKLARPDNRLMKQSDMSF